MLTANTAWSTVDSGWERLKPKIDIWFHGYDLDWYASASEPQTSELYRHFQDENIASRTLRARLRDLVKAAQRLVHQRDTYGTLDAYFCDLVNQAGCPREAASSIGRAGPHKLPGLGLALAAEALKNLGYDVAKPDRHILRAVGSFGGVSFRNWPDRCDFKHPEASDHEKLLAMAFVEDMARATGNATVLVDNSIWLLCSEPKSGLHFTNRELERLARSCSK